MSKIAGAVELGRVLAMHPDLYDALIHVTSPEHGKLTACPHKTRALCPYKQDIETLHRVLTRGQIARLNEVA